MEKRVNRKGLKIKLKPQPELEPGAIFQYTGAAERLKGLVLIHGVNPRLDVLSDRDGRDIFDTDHVVAEVLVPEKGYSDYCLFWIEKRYLRMPNPEVFTDVSKKLKTEVETIKEKVSV